MGDSSRQPAIVVVMGVSGCGKSSTGLLLSERLGVPFLEADDLHPAANRAKMAAGRPLTEEDRRPWLAAVSLWIAEASASRTGGVVACSALKYRYRQMFRRAGARVWLLHLALDEGTALRRVARRRGHFMPAALVDSQYAELEPLRPDEPGLTVDAENSRQAIVDRAAAALHSTGWAGGAPYQEPG
ncbi:gluconokinase [Streptomyces sp. NPDC002667]|uniref:gluconokinase n=1 Tax=Streptomyces sp. NPDC002667 TaxID=3364657 RepID=UPI0036B67776